MTVYQSQVSGSLRKHFLVTMFTNQNGDPVTDFVVSAWSVELNHVFLAYAAMNFVRVCLGR